MRPAAVPLRYLRRVWADRPLQAKGLVIIALPVLILFSALFWVGVTTRQEEAAEDSVQRTLEIQADLKTVEAILYRTALIAELAPGSGATRERIKNAAVRVPLVLARLAAAIQDREQARRLRSLNSVARRQIAILANGAAPSAERAAALDALGRVLQGMSDREAMLFAERRLQADQARAENLAISRIAALVGLIGSLAAILLFSSGVVRRVAVLEANAHRLARGAPLRRVPAGADEIGRLGNALDEASALLSERQQRLEELVGRLFQVQEDERRRVAYELHDGLAQVAAAAHQHLQAYAERFPPEPPEAQLALSRGLTLVQRAVRETRATIAGLRPTALDDFGLAPALKQEVDAIRPELREAVFEDAMNGHRLPAAAETALFRIAQEALTNVRKHAGASVRVRVRLEHRDGRVRLSISDDGRGFDLSKVATMRSAGERIGLDAMRERVALLGGRLNLVSTPATGTQVEVVLDLG